MFHIIMQTFLLTSIKCLCDHVIQLSLKHWHCMSDELSRGTAVGLIMKKQFLSRGPSAVRSLIRTSPKDSPQMTKVKAIIADMIQYEPNDRPPARDVVVKLKKLLQSSEWMNLHRFKYTPLCMVHSVNELRSLSSAHSINSIVPIPTCTSGLYH